MQYTSFDRARAARFLAGLALSVVSLAAVAEITFKSSRVKVGVHPLKVELAVSDEERSRGLMFRKTLGHDEGMLFVFDELGYHSMWMKDTLLPLSVAFIDADGKIINILDMEPQTLDTHSAAGPARYAIETNKGWFEEKKVKAGDKVTGLPKPPPD